MMLEEFVNSRVGKQFKWGSNDCCLFVADALIHIGHPDYGLHIRGYSSELGAWLAINKVAEADSILGTLRWLAAEYDFTWVSPGEVFEDGDVACLEVPCRPMRYFKEPHGMGIYYNGRFYTTGATGLYELAEQSVIECWRPKCLSPSLL